MTAVSAPYLLPNGGVWYPYRTRKRSSGDVFEMFTQVGGGTSRPQGGLGIGLTLSRRIAELHGGQLEAHSRGLGMGSRFEIRLPRRTTLPEVVGVEASDALDGPREGVHRILVVDDNRDAADALAKVLRLRGFESSVAYDGRAAVDCVRMISPDVIILDIGLPDITGYPVAAEIAQNRSTLAPTLVALTGWASLEDRERSAGAGFDHHLVKPASTREVFELLAKIAREHTERRRA